MNNHSASTSLNMYDKLVLVLGLHGCSGYGYPGYRNLIKTEYFEQRYKHPLLGLINPHKIATDISFNFLIEYPVIATRDPNSVTMFTHSSGDAWMDGQPFVRSRGSNYMRLFNLTVKSVEALAMKNRLPFRVNLYWPGDVNMHGWPLPAQPRGGSWGPMFSKGYLSLLGRVDSRGSPPIFEKMGLPKHGCWSSQLMTWLPFQKIDFSWPIGTSSILSDYMVVRDERSAYRYTEREDDLEERLVTARHQSVEQATPSKHCKQLSTETSMQQEGNLSPLFENPVLDRLLSKRSLVEWDACLEKFELPHANEPDKSGTKCPCKARKYQPQLDAYCWPPPASYPSISQITDLVVGRTLLDEHFLQDETAAPIPLAFFGIGGLPDDLDAGILARHFPLQVSPASLALTGESPSIEELPFLTTYASPPASVTGDVDYASANITRILPYRDESKVSGPPIVLAEQTTNADTIDAIRKTIQSALAVNVRRIADLTSAASEA
ncbi:hypothetical protein MMC09_000992 [Bachmanniomyces sp. S44760]|nr:hypothetical protein [Bachmanniomyces sp. S44760]